MVTDASPKILQDPHVICVFLVIVRVAGFSLSFPLCFSVLPSLSFSLFLFHTLSLSTPSPSPSSPPLSVLFCSSPRLLFSLTLRFSFPSSLLSRARTRLRVCVSFLLMMIAFITFKSGLVPLFEGLWSSNSWEFELSGFRRNRTDDLRIDSPSLWPTEPRLHVRSTKYSKAHACVRARARTHTHTHTHAHMRTHTHTHAHTHTHTVGLPPVYSA